MKMDTFKPGDRVHYHPRIGGPADEREYEVEALWKLGHGETVAKLSGKTGCVRLVSLSHVPSKGAQS